LLFHFREKNTNILGFKEKELPNLCGLGEYLKVQLPFFPTHIARPDVSNYRRKKVIREDKLVGMFKPI
jgi:hypothetical protein